VFGRFREDEQLPDGIVLRREKQVYLGTTKELPTDKLAYRELEKHVQHINEVTYRPRLASDFASFADRWQASVMVTHKRSAQESEASHIRKHLIPRFGALTMKIIESDPEAVQAWVSGLKLEPKSVKNIVTTARLMFDTAREWRYVTYNPFDKLRLKPQGLKDEEFALSLEQIRSIIEAAPEPYKTLYWILGETGIRIGEGLALGFEHLDLKERLIFIRRKVWRGELETVKSRKGVRSFAISEQLAEHLKVFANGQKSGFMFTRAAAWKDTRSPDNGADGEGHKEHRLCETEGADGPRRQVAVVHATLAQSAGSRHREQESSPARTVKPITYDHAVKEEFQPLLAKLGIPQCGFHAFRHGNATLMDQLNVPAKTRMDRLGHEKMDTTFGYTHGVSKDDRDIAAKLGDMISGSVQ
jgi:integrase